MNNKCAKCGIASSLQCVKCGLNYCSKKCQVADWANHKVFCDTKPDYRRAIATLITYNSYKVLISELIWQNPVAEFICLINNFSETDGAFECTIDAKMPDTIQSDASSSQIIAHEITIPESICVQVGFTTDKFLYPILDLMTRAMVTRIRSECPIDITAVYPMNVRFEPYEFWTEDH